MSDVDFLSGAVLPPVLVLPRATFLLFFPATNMALLVNRAIGAEIKTTMMDSNI